MANSRQLAEKRLSMARTSLDRPTPLSVAGTDQETCMLFPARLGVRITSHWLAWPATDWKVFSLTTCQFSCRQLNPWTFCTGFYDYPKAGILSDLTYDDNNDNENNKSNMILVFHFVKECI